MHVAAQRALALVQAASAGEDEIGALEQMALQQHEARRGEAEGGELVHAVIDAYRRRDMPGEAERHRGVEPGNRDGAAFFQEPVEQIALKGVGGAFVQRVGEHRRDHEHAFGRRLRHQPRRARLDDRLLEEHDIVVARRTRQQMLRALEYGIPAQMGEADEKRRPCRPLVAPVHAVRRTPEEECCNRFPKIPLTFTCRSLFHLRCITIEGT